MRRIPRLRTPVTAGFCSSSAPSTAPLRAPAAAALTPSSSSSACTLSAGTRQQNISRQTRYLSTTPLRPSSTSEPAEPYYYEDETPAIKTSLVYPTGIINAPAPAAVTDASYTPAETADGLEEVGGLADWWENPAHWGSDNGASGVARACAQPFGPTAVEGGKVTDAAVLEVLARRAVVEALVVGKFVTGGKMGEKVDRLFNAMGAEERLEKIVRAEIVAGKDGVATLGDFRDWQRVWDFLRLAARKQPQVEKKGSEAEAVEAQAEAEAPAAPKLTPELAKELVQSWGAGWRKAELKDPVVKFFAAKRIQQLTGHRIPDGKLYGVKTIDGLLKQLIESPKALKLAELVEAKGVFQGLSNVRVFPRRVTPIDKEKMVGRWKIIVRELEKRELPITGTGDYGEAVEKKWIEGRV